MNEAEDGAHLMKAAADKALEAAHKAIFDSLEASGLSEKRKIGACVTAVTELYHHLLTRVIERGSPEGVANLTTGLFEEFISEPLQTLYSQNGTKKNN